MSKITLELIYIAAYTFFLMGAAKSFRDNGSRSAVTIMSLGVLLDVGISLLPMTGMPFLQVETKEASLHIKIAIGFGIATIWMVYPIALLLRKKGKMSGFHFLIGFMEICWFIDIVLFMYDV
jgi:hypothetical protein